MKSCFSCLGIIFLVIIIACAGLFGYGFYISSRYEPAARQYTDATIPIVFANWDPAELLNRESPEFKRATTDDATTKLFAELKTKLGPLVKYNGAKGGVNSVAFFSTGRQISAFYKADVEFQKGSVTIDYTLILHDGRWQIGGFFVHLPINLKP